MPSVEIDSTLTMFYEDNWFGEPWCRPDVALLVHGIAESSRAWYAWVPGMASELRMLRPDLRGFGQSTIPKPDFQWSAAAFALDLKRFLDKLEIDAVHIVGAKFGGSIAFQFAADYPERTRTLAVLSGPSRAHRTGGSMDLTSVPNRIREVGVRGWAAETQRARLGSEVPDEQLTWWTDMMSGSDPRVCIGVSSSVNQLDLFNILPRIQAPTLLVTTDRSPLQSVETVRETQLRISDSELLVLPSDSYHIAAAQPAECCSHVLNFIVKRRTE